jgi:hypothetical protein
MKCFQKEFVIGLMAIVVGAISLPATAATFEIESASGLFTPSFRGGANSTWFGWAPNTFDGAPNDELINSPAPTIGTAAGTLVQNNSDDVLSGSNNIYSGIGVLDLTVTAPTAGTLGQGFTTIIVQGRTLFGGFGVDPVFGDISGVSPTYVQAINSASPSPQGQFWVKYEIPGNLTSYDINIGAAANSHISLGELVVDTFWSADAYAPDLAAVPEPNSIVVLALGSLFVPLVKRWRSR